MTGIDRLFETSHSAVDLFTDRLEEHALFRDSVRRHLERVADGTAALSVEERHNVLTYFGIGGAGKTELSRRLERWLVSELPEDGEWGPPLRTVRPIHTVREDFHGKSSFDVADLVLRLRGACAHRGARFPAFDLGFAAWWALAHPGTALPKPSGKWTFDVRGQITDTLNDVLSDAGARFGVGPLSVRAGMLLVDAVRKHRLRDKALRECAPLVALVDEARRDPSDYVLATIAGLLSWDLERLDARGAPLIVAFADAVEYIQGGDRRQERLWHRVVHLTPRVLWVVTSRRSLDWDSPKLVGVLPAAGPHVWAGLRIGTASMPRQHLMGLLSDADVDRFLATASGRDGNPVLTPEASAMIRQGAHGLPLYVDLSLSVARQMRGGVLDPAAFGRPLPQLVQLIFADLPNDEREIARAAALLPRFDPELIARATGGRLGDAFRFCERSLVSRDMHPYFGYRLHDAVRAAIVEEPLDDPGAWAAADRTAQADQLLSALDERRREAVGDIEALLAVVELAAGLCAAQNREPSWLLEALTDLPLARVAERLPSADERTWIGQIARLYSGFRRGRSYRERAEHLKRLLSTPLPPDVARRARFRLAYTHRMLGERGNTLATLQELLAEQPDDQAVRYQVTQELISQGRFAELWEQLARFPLVGRYAEHAGYRLDFVRGEVAAAASGIASRAAWQRERGKHRLALENEALSTWQAALAGQASVADCEELIAKTDSHGVSLELRTALAAKVLCLSDADETARRAFDEARAVIEGMHGRRGWREWASELAHALRGADQPTIVRLREEWDAALPEWTPMYQVVDHMFVYAGNPPSYSPVEMADGTSPDEVSQRWYAIIEALVKR